MKTIKKQPLSSNCFVCGVNNPIGLKMEFFETEDGEVLSNFTLNENYQSYTNRVHCGIISTILDETMARSIMVLEEGAYGETVEIKVNFKKPISINQE